VLRSIGGAVDVRGAVETFLTDVEARNLSPKTRDYYDWQLGKFGDWLQHQGVDVSDLEHITPAVIRAYLVDLRKRGLKDTSVHAAARAIRAWGFFLEREGLLELSPMRRVKMPKVGRHILPALPAGDVLALLGACDTARDRAVVLFLLDSGLRAAEFVKLNVDDVDQAGGVVFVHDGKGAKDRVTHIEAATRAALAAYMAERGPVPADAPLWVTYDVIGSRCESARWFMDRRFSARRLTQQGLNMLVKRLGLRAGVKVSPHAFRRTCALSMHRSGARLTEIAGLLGHSDLATLQRYLDLQTQDAVAAHRAHSPVAALLGSG